MPKPKTVRAYFDSLEPHQGAIALALENAIKHALAASDGQSLPGAFRAGAVMSACFPSAARRIAAICNSGRALELADDYLDRIEGTGKSLRHVKVYSVDQVNDELIDIMDRAVIARCHRPAARSVTMPRHGIAV